MSLAEAVTEITNDLEKEALPLSLGRDWVLTYVKMLRMAVKAAETVTVPVNYSTDWKLGQQWAAKAQQEFSNKEKLEEEVSEHMTVVVDGPFQDNLIPIASSMPIGARTYIGTEIYQLGSDGLWHCPPICQGDLDDMKKP